MKQFFLLAVCASVALGASAAPKPAAPAKKVKTTLKTLNYCPISGEKLPSKTVGATTYKGNKIAFCCPGCPEAFAAMSAKDKDAKIARIAAKQAKAGAKAKA